MTSIRASRVLFCVTSSLACAAMLNRNRREPTSEVFSRTFTVCDSPSPGSVTSCVLTMRPASSTTSGTFRPA